MRLHEAAELLHVTETTLGRWMRQGLLPAHAVAGEPFDRGELERWARDRGLPFCDVAARAPERTERMLSSAIARGAVLGGLTADTASEAIEAAVRAVPGLDTADRADVLERVLDRERLASTALGRGVALPHPRQPLAGVLADPVAVVVHLRRPLDWAALDGELVHTGLLLLSPSAPVHLQLLSRVSLLLRAEGFVDIVRAAPPRDELVAEVRALEEALGS